MEPIRSFDDLVPGQELDFGTFAMPLEEILDFARRWDPQPFHVDAERAAHGPFGGLIASGLHTLSATFGHMIRTGVLERVSLGGAGVEVNWPAPVRPGDVLAVRARVESLTPSRSKPDRGIARLRYSATRVADGALVLDVVSTIFLRR